VVLIVNSIYDIQQLLKKYGTVIYIGKRLYDLQLMEDELKELYQSQLVDPKEFQTALLIIRHEIQIEKEKQID
jgi:uncharacterized protein YqgQ